MFRHTHTIRKAAAGMALVSSLALVAVPTAFGFDGRSPDTRDAASQSQPAVVLDGRSVDTLDAAQQAQLSTVDGRSADTRDLAQQALLSTVVDGRSADTLDAAVQATTPLVADGRSPDTVDAGVLGRTQVIEITPSSFSWGDFGIGAAAAVGALFILVGLGIGMREARQARHRLGHA